jgi:hypothetical protein
LFDSRRYAFEISYGFAYPCADFGQLPGSENNQDNDHNSDKFRHTNSKHKFLLLPEDRVMPFCLGFICLAGPFANPAGYEAWR